MGPKNTVDVRARGISADALDEIRPLARRRGFSHTNNDVVRFAVLLTAEIARSGDGRTIADAVPQQPRGPLPKMVVGPPYPFE